jgi:hypothetical protein
MADPVLQAANSSQISVDGDCLRGWMDLDEGILRFDYEGKWYEFPQTYDGQKIRDLLVET